MAGEVGKVGQAQIYPPPQGAIDLPSPSSQVLEALTTGRHVERYRRIWRVGGPELVEGVLYGRLGYTGTHLEDLWDPELDDFDETDVLGGMATPFAISLSDLRVVFQVRGADIRVQSFVGALQALLRDATGQDGWRVVLPRSELSFSEWHKSVQRVTRLRVRVLPPNPNYEGRPEVERLIEGARLASASLDLKGEGVRTDAEIVAQLLDHVERGYGEASAVGEVDTDSGEVETVYNSTLGGSTALSRREVDAESGQVSREVLADELGQKEQEA